MHSLKYYFGKAASDHGDEVSVGSGPACSKPAVTLVIGKKKRPVGRPKKAAAVTVAAKLVDYSSSSESENRLRVAIGSEKRNYNQSFLHSNC